MIVSLFSPHSTRAGQVVPGFRPCRWEATWPEFVSAMHASSKVPADRADKMKVLSISMAEFVPDTNRAKANVVGVDWIAFDFDDKTGLSKDAWKFDDLVAFLEPMLIPFVVYTTASSTLEGHCLRLVMPFDRRVSAEEFPRIWLSFNHWLRSVADAQTKDASRLFFEPRQWIGAYNRFHAAPTDFPPVAVDAIVERHGPPEEPAFDAINADIVIARLEAIRTDRRSLSDHDICDLDNSPIISVSALADAMSSSEGGRMFKFLCSVAVSAARQQILLTHRDLTIIGERLAFHLCRQCRDIAHDAKGALKWAQQVAATEHSQKTDNFRTMLKGIW